MRNHLAATNSLKVDRENQVHVSPGGLSEAAPPVPIPNTVVKRLSTDDTAFERVWENRSLPGGFSFGHERNDGPSEHSNKLDSPTRSGVPSTRDADHMLRAVTLRIFSRVTDEKQ